MIIVKLYGGLGNQLFQYATARSLALKNKTELSFDLHDFSVNKKREYLLSGYTLPATIASNESVQSIFQDNRLLNRLLGKSRWHIYREKNLSYDQRIADASGDIYLDGHWMNEKYFAQIRTRLLKELLPKRHKTYDFGKNSVSIHIRRGDYASEQETKKVHGVLPISYYKKAILKMKKIIDNPVFYIFSDDLTWVHQHRRSFGQVKIMVGDSPNEDLYAMSHCSHHIIANSTFSWWGGWLSTNPHQVVIAPKKWYASGRDENIVPKKWLRL